MTSCMFGALSLALRLLQKQFIGRVEVASGKPVSSESLPGLVARAYAQYYDVDWDFVGEDLEFIEDSLNRITTREREVLDLLVDGFSSREIASQLGVSTKTAEAHRARINDKMRSNDLAHLVRMVLAVREA